MSEIKPVYQAKRFDETGWSDVTQESYKNCELAQTVLETRILYPAAAYEALQKDHSRLLLTIEAMKVGQRVLQGAIQVSSMTDSEWREKYMREVEGLNNEGDPIGGDPPSGLRHQVEALKAENTKLEDELDQYKEYYEEMSEHYRALQFIESELRKELAEFEAERNRRDEMRKALEAQMNGDSK